MNGFIAGASEAEGRASVRDRVQRAVAHATLPSGDDERMSGYGVMGLPFSSGHVLVLRRFGASSLGRGYAAVWHRAPSGEWTLYADVPPGEACPRWMGEAATAAVETPIHLTWPAESTLRIELPAVGLEWEVEAGSSAATRLMTLVGRLLPERIWWHPAVLAVMARVAGPLLGVGRVALTGQVPNRQQFRVTPRELWRVRASRARLGTEDLGLPSPLPEQARLGDFWVPQRGILAIGQARFERFDASRHSARTAGAARR